jgi:asparagine synthetase B (glutamine-hydrolysing)
MCGIAGMFAPAVESPPVDSAELHRIRDRMAVRGPDGAGDWLSPDGRVGLAHRRLATTGLSDASAQPTRDPVTGPNPGPGVSVGASASSSACCEGRP